MLEHVLVGPEAEDDRAAGRPRRARDDEELGGRGVDEVDPGARLDVAGVLWGLLAAVGLVVFFLIAADEEEALPPISFAGGGLAVGALGLLAVAALGWLPVAASTDPVDLAGWSAPWWVAVVELAIVAGAVAYASGIAAARLLGGTIASFVGLSEVLFAIVFAWLIVGQAMSPVQVLGVPVADEFADYLNDVLKTMKAQGIRVELDETDDRFPKKIRNASKSKVPFVLIAGAEDQAAGAVSFRYRDGSQENGVPVEAAIEKVTRAIADRVQV